VTDPLETDLALRSTLDFLKTEAGGGVALVLGAAVALVWANSPYAETYFRLIDAPFSIRIGAFAETLPLRGWVSDGLMAVFFFVFGLELKHEALKGELASPRKFALPVGAALGGLLASGLAYGLVNLRGGTPAAWPAAGASDLAAALAAFALAARRAPESLRLFFLSMAMAGNTAALVLGMVVSTGHVLPWALVAGALTLAGLIGLSEWKEAPILVRVAGFLTLGAFALRSGVSTALAGVAAALTVPIGPRRSDQEGVLKHFIESLHPYVAFGVLPLYAFTQLGLPLVGRAWMLLVNPVSIGLLAALIIAKPAGVLAGAWLMIRMGLARRPTGATWLELTGVALLAGVGFSMTLYVGGMAMAEAPASSRDALTLGALVGSLVAALVGGGVLALATARRDSIRLGQDSLREGPAPDQGRAAARRGDQRADAA
jgi:NhaA family Na+:H+ antiporter